MLTDINVAMCIQMCIHIYVHVCMCVFLDIHTHIFTSRRYIYRNLPSL